MIVKGRALKDFYFRVLTAVGTLPHEADITADALLDADLHGLETHGALRIPPYVRMAREGALKPSGQPFLEWQRGAVSLINGDNGWGQPAAYMAVQQAVRVAKQHHVSAVGVRNTNHIGSCAYYGRKLASEGMIGFVTTNSPSNMPPWGGAEPILGTNPICFSAPASNGSTVVIDMATSVVAKGKILLAAQRGEAIPEGWALDKNGRATTDPKAALEGYMLPVGGPKGYGLALFADILAGVLTGSRFGIDLHSMYEDKLLPSGVGVFMFAVDISAYGLESFYDRMDRLCQMVVGARKIDGVSRIYLPGEPETEKARRRTVEGIPISEPVFTNLNKIAAELGIKPLS